MSAISFGKSLSKFFFYTDIPVGEVWLLNFKVCHMTADSIANLISQYYILQLLVFQVKTVVHRGIHYVLKHKLRVLVRTIPQYKASNEESK